MFFVCVTDGRRRAAQLAGEVAGSPADVRCGHVPATAERSGICGDKEAESV